MVGEGTLFEEPEDGFAKIIILDNGNTAYLQITKKEGISLRIYNSEFKETVNKTLSPSYGKLKAAAINGIFEIDDNIAVFISERDGKTPTLYRLLINAQTGELTDTKTIGTLNDVSLGQGYAMAYGQVPEPEFFTRKDPETDYHGVVLYNTFSKKADERVELIQYTPMGVEQFRTFLSSPSTKYKYTQLLDYTIVGAEAYVLLYSYNTANSGGAANELLLATIKNGAVTYSNLGNTTHARINDGMIRYNPKTKNLIFLTIESMSRKMEGLNKSVTIYGVLFNIIDPQTASIVKTVEISQPAADGQCRKLFNNKKSFQGMPQQLYINPDGSFTLVSEEVTQLYKVQNGSMSSAAARPVGYELGSIAVSVYNEDGTEKSSQFIPKLQTNMASMWNYKNYALVDKFYIAQRDNAATLLSGGNQFKSFAYLHGKNNQYILMNDVAENEKLVLKGKLTNVKGVGDCEAFEYNLSHASSTNPLLPRSFVFSKEKEKDRNLAIFSISDYNSNRDLYATLKLEKGKGVRLIWLKD